MLLAHVYRSAGMRDIFFCRITSENFRYKTQFLGVTKMGKCSRQSYEVLLITHHRPYLRI